MEIDMQKKLEEKENIFNERERQFEEERERKIANINYLREVAEREMDDLKGERSKTNKQKEELAANKEDLESRRLDIDKDIEDLVILNKVKDNKEQFLKERERFMSFVKKVQSCESCGEIIHSFVFSNQYVHHIESPEFLARSMAEKYVRKGVNPVPSPGQQNNETSPGTTVNVTPKSGGKPSWLQRCASFFSPSKKIEVSPMHDFAGVTSPVDQQANVEPASDRSDAVQRFNGSSFGVVNHYSLDNERTKSEENVRMMQGSATLLAEAGVIGDEAHEEGEALELAGLNREHRPRKKGRSRVTRTRSVKAVMRDAEAIFGNAVEQNEGDDLNEHPEESVSSFADAENKVNERKRNRAHTSHATASVEDVDDSEGDSLMASGRKKRRQKVDLSVQMAAGNRYNLRRPNTHVMP